jgi:hypothetical protein
LLEGGSFCASVSSPHHFCDDFEDPAPLATRWQIVALAGGRVALAPPDSGPNTAVFSAPPVDGGADPVAFLLRDFPQVTNHVRESFALRMETRGGGLSVAPLTRIRFGPPVGGGADFLLVADQTRAYAYERLDSTDGGEATFLPHAVNGTLATGAWIRVAIDIVFEPKPAKVTVLVDDAAVAGPEPLSPSFVAGALQAHVGLDYTTSPSSGWQLAIDDVLVEWQ